VATISRLLQIIGFFCKRALWKRRYSSKETCDFKEPTISSPVISVMVTCTFKQLRNHLCGTTHLYVRWVSFICAMSLIYVCPQSRYQRRCHELHIHATSQSFVWHDSFMCAMSFIYMCHESHLCVPSVEVPETLSRTAHSNNFAVICVAWLVHMSHSARYKVAKTHRMPYLYSSFFVKEPYN